MTKQERLLATTTSRLLKTMIDNVAQEVDQALYTTSEDKMKMWAYLMVQYNLKPGLRKFGNGG
jgi:hypothetical protein